MIKASLASVPRIELAKRYVHRDIWSRQDFEIFDYARSKNINILIYGPTGPGKTTSVEAWAAERSLRMATVSGNASMEPSQMTGKFVSDGNGSFAWIDGPVTDVVRNGGVLLLDEVNFISPKIYTVLYGLLDGRRAITLLDHHGETIEAHPDLTIFATMNPDYIGTTPLNFAFRNRFDIQIPWDYDDKVEAKLVSSKALLVVAKQLRVEAAKGQYETPISTNMLQEFVNFVDALGYEFAVENFIAHFNSDEAASVRLVFQTHEHNIKTDFGIEIPIVVEQAPEELSPEEQLKAWAGQYAAKLA
jgi:MoxR-like ATPase